MRSFHQNRGFTLAELLVVIGIIGLLIGILVPVLSGVQARGRDLACQSNIRQCVQLILAYAAENRSQLPYGFYWDPRGGHNGWQVDVPDTKLISVWSILSRMSSASYGGATRTANYGFLPGILSANEFAPFLRCPEALQVQFHLCSYVVSLTAFVTPSEDGQTGAHPDGPAWKRLVERPTKTTQCLPFTALLWDTAVHPGMATNTGAIFGGDIDEQRFWRGAIRPQYRYYSIKDPFAPLLGNNRSVRLDVGPHKFRNIDPPDGAVWPYQGNLRFRHRNNKTCNVGFADGSVRQFTGKFTSDGYPISHDAQRKCFMVKWLSGLGLGPDPSLPH